MTPCSPSRSRRWEALSSRSNHDLCSSLLSSQRTPEPQRRHRALRCENIPMRATVIILSWNGVADLPACLDAVLSQAGGDAALLVVDNGSVDGSAALVRERYPAAQLVENGRNLGFSAGMNVGIRLLRDAAEPPDVVVLLNQDTIVASDWLANILAPLEQDDRVAAVGCKIYYLDGRTLQHAGAWLEPGRAIPRHYGYGVLDEGQYDQPRDLEWVTGAALALRCSALDEVGLFDEGYSPAYIEDI